MVATKKPVIFVVGPTASGKSGLAMQVARKYDGEIVCADSQTLRRGLDIGTAKPSTKDQEEIRHHMLDIIGPYDSYSVTEFQKLAQEAIQEIQSREKLPIVVGGTGLYIDSLFYEYDLGEHNTNNSEKEELQSKSIVELQSIIEQNNWKMPENKQNPRHLIGAILRRGHAKENSLPMKNAVIYGLFPGDAALQKRIARRVEKMLEQGLVDEVESIVSEYGKPPNVLDAIGYPILQEHLEGKISLEQAQLLLTRGHRQYARRQKSWFKRNEYVQWFPDSEQAYVQIAKELSAS